MPSAKLIPGIFGVPLGTSGGAELCSDCTCPYCACSVSYDVTFADVELLTGCTNKDVGSVNTSTTTFAGTFTLTFQPRLGLGGPCVWLYTQSPVTSIAGTRYANPGCAGGTSAYSSISIALRRDSIGSSQLIVLIAYGGGLSASLFTRTLSHSDADPCNPLTGWANAQSAFAYQVDGKNGTATLAEEVEEDI